MVDNADIKFLNDLKFPNDYLTKNSPSTVTGNLVTFNLNKSVLYFIYLRFRYKII